MNNLPERVFIDEYYKENKRTTYPACATKENQGDIEYIRKDLVI